MLNSKRGKGKVKIDKGMYDGYLHYCKTVKQNDMPEQYKLTRTEYGKIMKIIHKEMVNHILYDSGTFKLPAGLPAIRVKKYKRQVRFREDGSIDGKALAPNWPKTRELWDSNPVAKKQKKIVYFINDHTDGYSAMVWMDKSRSSLRNLSPYQFKACRKVQRELGSILLNPYNDIDYYL